MGHFPTKQTQNLHLAVSKNRQIWEKLSHYFPLPVYGIKICKCDKPGCFIRQYTIVSSMKMTMYVTEAKFHVYRLCVKQLIVVEIYKNTHANVNATIHMLTLAMQSAG